MKQEEALRLVGQANPAPMGSAAPGAFLSPTALLERIYERSDDMHTQDKPIAEEAPVGAPPQPPKTTHRPLIPALAGATVVILAIVVAFMTFGGNGSPDTATDPADLHGVWLTHNGYYTSFDEDGSWGVAPNPGGTPFNWGTYTFDGEKLTFLTEKPFTSDTCQDGQTGIYEARITDEGNLSLTRISDPCSVRVIASRNDLLRY